VSGASEIRAMNFRRSKLAKCIAVEVCPVSPFENPRLLAVIELLIQ
jgi:hypothetical protein